jgi:SpoVK/Ycf46/Vps4 family AAA+-type ATPase
MKNEVDKFLPQLSELTRGYSGSDLKEVCRAAAMTPIHEIMAEASRRAVMGETSILTDKTVNPKLRPLCKQDRSRSPSVWDGRKSRKGPLPRNGCPGGRHYAHVV